MPWQQGIIDFCGFGQVQPIIDQNVIASGLPEIPPSPNICSYCAVAGMIADTLEGVFNVGYVLWYLWELHRTRRHPADRVFPGTLTGLLGMSLPESMEDIFSDVHTQCFNRNYFSPTPSDGEGITASLQQGRLLVGIIDIGPEFVSNSLSTSGVYRKPTTVVDTHSIEIVGDQDELFVCKNSFGESWGQRGYFLVPKDPNDNSLHNVREMT